MRHGGDLDEAARLTGRPLADWLDLSTGINRAPWPVPPDLDPGLAPLPRAADLAALEAAARRAYRVPDGLALAAAPGTQAIIQWLPFVVPARARVTIAGPTYGEHAAAWAAAGHRVATVPAESFAETACDAGAGPGTAETAGPPVAVLCNPNNPDGRASDPETLRVLAARLAGAGGLLVVDEAFADVAPALSILPRIDAEPVVVLRSFGKFFGLAGIRLGFAAGAGAIVDGLRARLGPWSVSGPAIAIGTRALADADWSAAARTRLAAAARRLDGVLAAAGLTVLGGTSLFRLAAHRDAVALAERLAAAGIWVRRFDDEPTWLRFGIPIGEAECARLADALGVPAAARATARDARRAVAGGR